MKTICIVFLFFYIAVRVTVFGDVRRSLWHYDSKHKMWHLGLNLDIASEVWPLVNDCSTRAGRAIICLRSTSNNAATCINPHLRGRGTIWYSQLWMAFSPKVPMYKNSETACIPSPKYCLYTYVYKFMKHKCFHKFLSTFFLSGIEYHIWYSGAM